MISYVRLASHLIFISPRITPNQFFKIAVFSTIGEEMNCRSVTFYFVSGLHCRLWLNYLVLCWYWLIRLLWMYTITWHILIIVKITFRLNISGYVLHAGCRNNSVITMKGQGYAYKHNHVNTKRITLRRYPLCAKEQLGRSIVHMPRVNNPDCSIKAKAKIQIWTHVSKGKFSQIIKRHLISKFSGKNLAIINLIVFGFKPH